MSPIAVCGASQSRSRTRTVEQRGRRFRYPDRIINPPFSGIHRSLSAGGDERPKLMIGHPNPIEVVVPRGGRAAQNTRDYYGDQLRSLGLIHIVSVCVKTDWSNSPVHDVVLASHNPTAVKYSITPTRCSRPRST